MSWLGVEWAGWAGPAWLGALGLLAVPIVIHFLSRGRRRRVAVGSVRWLEPAATASARRLRPSRWWLLALRCLILALVALALAAPRFSLPSGSVAGRWALVSPVVAAERSRLESANEEIYRRLDELLATGATLRWLASGVAAAALDRPPVETVGDGWSLVHEASREAPAATAFEVFALDRAEQLRGARPEFGRSVTWHGLVDPEANRWVERAVPLDEGRVAVYVGTSDPAGTRFERLETGAPSGSAGQGGSGDTAGLSLESDPAGRRVELASGGTVAADDAVIVPDAHPAETTILFAPERAEDASYVRAAIHALRDGGAVALGAVRRLEIDASGSAAQTAAAARSALVFWLSPDPVPAGLRESRRTGGTLVSDALGRFENCDCAVGVAATGAAVRFDRRGAADSSVGPVAALWQDGRQRALLEAERLGAGSWLRLSSRFHPAWTDLVLSPAFPAWMLEVALGVSPAPTARRAASDRRAAPGQAAPREKLAAPGEARESSSEGGRWLWLAAMGLLGLERRVASGRAA